MCRIDDEQYVDLGTRGKQAHVRIDVKGSKPLCTAWQQTVAAIKNIRATRLWDTDHPEQRLIFP
ncbi:MAG: hypothetical protein ACYTBJ_19295 [Planctomycetota bacterium]